jgi:hypothetical protein
MAIIYSEFHHEQEAREKAQEGERPVKLFFRFHDKAERDAAVQQMETDREFTDVFAQMTDYQPDSSVAHGEDGLALRFREYDGALLEKTKKYFNEKAGRDVVVDCNEWIVESEEQAKELQERINWELKKTEPAKRQAEIVPISAPKEEEESPRKDQEVWREKRAA